MVSCSAAAIALQPDGQGLRTIEVSAVPEISAIVFDSNVFGRQALPNVKTIRLWAQACTRNNAELWIPEVVAYELAQHAVEAHAAFTEMHSAHLKRLEAWGQPVGEQLRPVGVDDVLSAILKAGAMIVPLAGDEAHDAILDQVLLRGAGSRKGGTKTGAADSAWVRSIIACNNGEPDGLIVVTGDTSALERTCQEMGVDIPRNGKHLGDVQHLLDESSPAAEELVAKFRDWLQAYFVGDLADPHSEGVYLTEIADLGPHHWWQVDPLPDDGYEPWELQDQRVSPVKEAGVVGEIQHDGWTDALTATVRLVAEVEEQYARQGPLGDNVEYRTRIYPASLQGSLRLFTENGDLRDDGVLEDVDLLRPSPADVLWMST
jgi:hypothetical protein